MSSSASLDRRTPPMIRPRKTSVVRSILSNPLLYLMLLPGVVYYIIFHYIPIYGVVIAFEDFKVTRGIFGSAWVGLQNFVTLFNSALFYRILKNSVLLSLAKLLFGFPAPIFLALMLNEIGSRAFKRTAQTIIYLPHFISWVVIAGVVISLLSPSDSGLVNSVIRAFGGKAIHFLGEQRFFRGIIVASDIWKEAGWGTIIYLAAISRIDPTLYEAAMVDGANRTQQVWHITIPSIATTVLVIFILRTGSILSNGFEQIFLLQNPLTYSVSDVFETYTYRTGLLEGRFSYSTAVGLFQSFVGMIFILISNTLSRWIRGTGLW